MVQHADYNQLRNDILSFNKEYSINCVLEFDNNRLLPETKDGSILLSKRTELLLLLENLYPYSRDIQKLLFFYVAVDIQLFKNNSYENAQRLLPILEKLSRCDKVLDELEDVTEPLRIDLQMRALLRHELCHNILSNDSEQKQRCIEEARNIIEGFEFPGRRGCLIRRNQKKCLKDNNFLEENVCDAEIARWLAKCCIEGELSDTDFECICKQIVHSLYSRTFYGMVGEFYKNPGIIGQNKAMLLYATKNVIQINFFEIALMDSLKETLNDTQASQLVKNLENEAENFNLLLEATTSSLRDLTVGYSLSYNKNPSIISPEEKNEIAQHYFSLGESLYSALLKRLNK